MSKYKSHYVFLAIFALNISACSLFESQETSDASASSTNSGNANFDQMLADVTTKYKALAKEGGAWAFSGENLEKAVDAAKAKDIDKAMKLLKEVGDEVELARAQFEQQKNARPYLF